MRCRGSRRQGIAPRQDRSRPPHAAALREDSQEPLPSSMPDSAGGDATAPYRPNDRRPLPRGKLTSAPGCGAKVGLWGADHVAVEHRCLLRCRATFARLIAQKLRSLVSRSYLEQPPGLRVRSSLHKRPQSISSSRVLREFLVKSSIWSNSAGTGRRLPNGIIQATTGGRSCAGNRCTDRQSLLPQPPGLRRAYSTLDCSPTEYPISY